MLYRPVSKIHIFQSLKYTMIIWSIQNFDNQLLFSRGTFSTNLKSIPLDRWPTWNFTNLRKNFNFIRLVKLRSENCLLSGWPLTKKSSEVSNDVILKWPIVFQKVSADLELPKFFRQGWRGYPQPSVNSWRVNWNIK